MSETLIVESACREILFSKTAQTYFRLRSACGSQIERNSVFNFCRIKMKIKPWRLSKQLENQLDSVTENPFVFYCYKVSHVIGQNTHSRNIFSVHGFLGLSVNHSVFGGILFLNKDHFVYCVSTFTFACLLLRCLRSKLLYLPPLFLGIQQRTFLQFLFQQLSLL